MFNPNLKIQITKEKEFTLSLLRIPVNFFAEDTNPKKPEIKEKTGDFNNNSENTNDTAPHEEHITLKPGEHKQITVALDDISNQTTNNVSGNSPKKNNEQEEISKEEKEEEPKTGTQNNEEPENKTEEQSNDSQESKNEEPNTNTQDNTEIPSPTSPPNVNSSPSHAQPTHSTPPPSHSPTSPSSSNNNSDKDKKTPDNNSSNKEPKKDQRSPSKKNDDAKKKKVDDLKKKFNNTKTGKKVNDAKNKVADKISKNPVASKAMQGLNKANDIKNKATDAKEAIKNLDKDKMQEMVGDAAVKAGAKAANAVAPGAGKAIEVVDKAVSQTKVGKKAKKAIGACCCTAGCLIPIIIVLVPVIILLQSFSWITNLFGKRSNNVEMYGAELTDSEYELLEEASTEFSMQEYTDLTTELNNPSWLKRHFTWWTVSKYPIQEATEKYINDFSTYTEKQAKDYNKKYQSLIDKGYVFSTDEGDLTSFGLAFQALSAHYTITNLKASSSAPKRTKTINGEKIIYTTYDPKGTHEALFEEVLNDLDTVQKRFNGQVDPNWFTGTTDLSAWLTNEDESSEPDWDEISIETILDTEVPNVYVRDAYEERTLSLRDLFTETSSLPHDANYDVNIVRQIIDLHDSLGNTKISKLYDQLVKKLSMLELMTYMKAYQSYYSEIQTFTSKTQYANIDMYKDPAFWAQFLTFTNVEHYLALASLSDHSLSYEIAVTSINKSGNNIEISEITKGSKTFVGIRKLENWYATYTFEPSIIDNSDGTWTYTLSNPTVTPTSEQQYLFDKYNVGYGLYNRDDTITEEEQKAKNENGFFALFETATGIEMSGYDEYGNPQIPTYQVDKKGNATTVSAPLQTENATISFNYNMEYSNATTAKYGISHKKHTGIDYAVPSGTTVVASSSGTAYITRGNTGYGNYVKIIHDDGYTSIYAHGNGTFYISDGSRVVTGQPIMQSGNSGNSTGPHLHFEVRTSSGTAINPTDYLYGNA